MPTPSSSNPEDIYINEEEEIQQILGAPPSWITKWGIPLLAFLFAIAMSLSWFIRYPQIISAPVVLTTNHQTVVGKLLLPSSSAKKVQLQQEVKIYLKAYPYQEFGVVNGSVHTIDTVSLSETFEVTVQLEQAMVSSTNQEIPFTPEMQGTADIIVADKRISDYFFDYINQLLQ